MRFFYRLERFDGGEYVVLELEEGSSRASGAIVPDRNLGQNYKIVMGAIEEYRRVVEVSRPEHFAVISRRLDLHFPGHSNVRFAISSAMTELFAKVSGLSVRELLMTDGLKKPTEVKNCPNPVVPEFLGGVFEVISLESKRCVLLRRYPNGEMEDVLDALSMYFEEMIRSSV